MGRATRIAKVKWIVRLLLVPGLLASAPGLAGATGTTDYLGSFTITGSVTAPWVRADWVDDAAEVGRLVGRQVTLARRAITGPRQLACRDPHYEVKGYALDMLFQGTLADPQRQAAALGFTKQIVPTLETGCDGPLDFHFADDHTAMFGLNNRIYMMTRNHR
jgi:hypothetical protein